MLFSDRSWQPKLNWDTPAGRVLDRLAGALPVETQWRIIVFGSAPLQLGLDPGFVSGDVDVISHEDIAGHCEKAGLLKGQAELYIEPCAITAFTASADWQLRACEAQRQHVRFILPHPIDILVSKIKRLEEKDLRAFRLVIGKTGHPTATEMIVALRRVVDVYRPNFDEESSGDPTHNTQVLWRELFGEAIDVRREIITPALAERKKSYGTPSGLKGLL